MAKGSLSRVWSRIRTTPGLGRDVAALVVVVALGLTSLVIILNHQDYVPPWSSREVFSADFDEVPGVNPSQHPKVQIAGVPVGQVDDFSVSPDGKHGRLNLSLEPGHPVFDNAHVVLTAVNPVNEMYVELNPGGPPGKPLAQNAVIPASQTEHPVQPDEIFDHLDTRTRAAVTDLLSLSNVALANAPQNLPPGLNATDAALNQFQPVLDQLEKRRSNIQQLVTDLSRISAAVGQNSERSAQLIDSTQQTLDVLSQHDNDLRTAIAQLPGTTGQLQNAMTGVQKLAGQLNPTLDDVKAVSDKLPSTLQKVSGVVDNLGDTVRAADPVVAQAGPVVDDLSPIVNDLQGALISLGPITKDLDPVTGALVPYLTDLKAFVFNTSSVFSPNDANGGEVRAHLAVPLPDAGVIPGSHGGSTK